MKIVFYILILSILLTSPIIASAQAEQQKLEFLLEQIEVIREQIARFQELIANYLYGEDEILIPLSNDDLQKVIGFGVEWFKNAQEENGHFKYEYIVDEDKYSDDDNIVRQAGALFVLGEILVRDTENIYELEYNVRKSISYFENLSIKGEYNGRDFQCIGNGYSCKLGTTSLALIGILDLIERYPELEDTYISLINDYITYILAMKIDDKGFRSYFYINRDAQTETESSYATGEAFLAIVRYYKFNPTNETKNIIDDTFTYIESELDFDTPLYLWAMAAIKDMYQIWPKQEYIDYVQAYTDWRVDGPKWRKRTNHNMCAYLEGITSAFSVINNYDEEIEFWLSKSAKLQMDNGGFLTGKTERTQRIDFTQHCISSYLQKLVDIEEKPLTRF